MKRIIVIHNKYRILGGEDIAVENEIIFLFSNLSEISSSDGGSLATSFVQLEHNNILFIRSF